MNPLAISHQFSTVKVNGPDRLGEVAVCHLQIFSFHHPSEHNIHRHIHIQGFIGDKEKCLGGW